MLKRKALLMPLTAVVIATVAYAASPHFKGSPSSVFSNGALTVAGQITGLGNENVTLVLSANVVSTCTNKGGNVPPGQTETLSAQINNLRPENGNLTFSITTGRITARCPGNQTPNTVVTSATLSVYQGGQLVLQTTF
jgi:hypothetical protein